MGVPCAAVRLLLFACVPGGAAHRPLVIKRLLVDDGRAGGAVRILARDQSTGRNVGVCSPRQLVRGTFSCARAAAEHQRSSECHQRKKFRCSLPLVDFIGRGTHIFDAYQARRYGQLLPNVQLITNTCPKNFLFEKYRSSVDAAVFGGQILRAQKSRRLEERTAAFALPDSTEEELVVLIGGHEQSMGLPGDVSLADRRALWSIRFSVKGQERLI